MNKIKGFIEKNDQRKKINAFYELIGIYRNEVLVEKIKE